MLIIVLMSWIVYSVYLCTTCTFLPWPSKDWMDQKPISHHAWLFSMSLDLVARYVFAWPRHVEPSGLFDYYIVHFFASVDILSLWYFFLSPLLLPPSRRCWYLIVRLLDSSHRIIIALQLIYLHVDGNSLTITCARFALLILRWCHCYVTFKQSTPSLLDTMEAVKHVAQQLTSGGAATPQGIHIKLLIFQIVAPSFLFQTHPTFDLPSTLVSVLTCGQLWIGIYFQLSYFIVTLFTVPLVQFLAESLLFIRTATGAFRGFVFTPDGSFSCLAPLMGLHRVYFGCSFLLLGSVTITNLYKECSSKGVKGVLQSLRELYLSSHALM